MPLNMIQSRANERRYKDGNNVISIIQAQITNIISLWKCRKSTVIFLFQNIFLISHIQYFYLYYTKQQGPLLTFCEQSTPMNPAVQIQVPLIVSQSPPFKHLQKFFDINQLYLINKNDLIRDIEECSTYIIDNIMLTRFHHYQ